MARIFPSKFPYPKDPRHSAEKKFFDSCKEQLDDSWIVLYGIDWFGHRDGRSKDGEADFLVMNEHVGILVVEVKGGRKIEVESGDWYTTPHGSEERKRIRDPFKQGAASKSFFIDYLRNAMPTVHLTQAIGIVAAFPGHEQIGDMSPLGRRFKVCDRFDLKKLEETLRNSARAQGLSLTTDQTLMQIKETLMPSFILDLNVYFDVIDELERLTDEQIHAFAMLRNQRELTVTGGAGTGKTVLAFNRARELALDGKMTLFLCHSSMLAAQLRNLVQRISPQLTNRLSLESVDEFISRADNFRLEKAASKEVTWPGEDLIEFFSLQAMDPDAQLDALIVDEAQNIPAFVVDLALVILKQDSKKYIFGDPNQGTIVLLANTLGSMGFLHQPGDRNALEEHGDELPIVLDLNCRSTAQIARFANNALGPSDAESSDGHQSVVDGFPVEVVVKQIANWQDDISDCVERWRRDYRLSLDRISLIWDPGSIPALSVMGDAIFGDDSGLLKLEGCALSWFDRLPKFDFPPNVYGNSYEAHALLLDVRQYLSESDSTLPGDPFFRMEAFDTWRKNTLREGRPLALRQAINAKSGDSAAQQYFSSLRQKDLDLPILEATAVEDFLGLESEAVIAIIPPLVSNEHSGEDWNLLWRRAMYCMTSRARTLLAVFVDPMTAPLLGL